jgi:hypothetical protein
MAISINGTGTITGIAVGGLPDGCVDNDTLATSSIKGLAKAWIVYDGAGTNEIRSSFNVTSVTDNGTGDYTFNFTTAFPDANYVVLGTPFSNGTSPPKKTTPIDQLSSISTTACRITVSGYGISNGSPVDFAACDVNRIHLAFIGN